MTKPISLRILPAAVVLASSVDWIPRQFPLPGRGGPYWAAAVLVVGLATFVWKAERPLDWNGRFRELDPRHRALFVSTGLVVACWALAALGAVDRLAALAEAVRILMVFLFFGLTATLVAKDEHPCDAIASVAAFLIGLEILLIGLGILIDGVGTKVFAQVGQHSVLGAIPRFRGLAEHPMACGSTTLLLTGLAAGRTGLSRTTRAITVAAGVGVVAATFSFAALALPAAGAFCLPGRKALRVGALLVVAAGALSVLWLNPLRLEFLGRPLLARSPVSSYFQDDRGPRYMPVHTISAPGIRFDFHYTGYALLAERSLSCAREHPLGVGGRNFVWSCPVMAMNTFGGWTSRRSAHNAYGALVAEGGLLATLATITTVCLFFSCFQLRSRPRWQGGVLVAYLLAGAGGATPYQFAFVALLACAAEPRISRKAKSRQDEHLAPEDAVCQGA